MTPRERILCALECKKPARAASALNFYRIEPDDLQQPNDFYEDMVDIQFIDFPLSPEEEKLAEIAETYPTDTRLGNFYQESTYIRWQYDIENVEKRNPLACAQSIDDLASFPFPDGELYYQVDYLKNQVQDLHERGLAAGGNLPHLGGELFEAAWRLRGLQNFLLDLIKRPAWAEFLLDRLSVLALHGAEALASSGIDVLALDDDVGMPGTMIISPKTWRKFFKHRMADIIQAAKAIKPDLKFIYHSDGYFEPIIDDLIEIGINAINPVQPEYMDAVKIRKKYDSKLALWGTVGCQTTFSFCTPDEIRKEVKHRIETLGTAGLIFCPAYDIDEPDIPWNNIAAFIDAVKTYG